MVASNAKVVLVVNLLVSVGQSSDAVLVVKFSGTGNAYGDGFIVEAMSNNSSVHLLARSQQLDFAAFSRVENPPDRTTHSYI